VKLAINPMNAAKRCRARSKRSGEPCRAPAVTGWNVCRFHGAGGGAPKGNANGNYRNGFYTQQAVQRRRMLRDVIRVVRDMLDEV
jgi:hypothetical protein